MTERSQYGDLQVAKELDKLLIEEILPGLNISEEEFWNSFNHIVEEFVPRNKSLIKDREELQNQIDQWHLDRRGQKHNHEEYKTFLKEIGYWVEGTKDFQITTSEVDAEISAVSYTHLTLPTILLV